MSEAKKKADIPLQVDQAMVRSNALLTDTIAVLVIALALLGIVQPAALIMVLLAVDFGIRGFANPRGAVLTRVSAAVVSPMLPFEHKLIYFPPKQFAARVGMVFSLTAAALFAGGLAGAGITVTSILLVFAALEWAANICMGCIVYNALVGMRRGMSGGNDGV